MILAELVASRSLLTSGMQAVLLGYILVHSTRNPMTLRTVNRSFSFSFGVLRPVAETGYSSRTAFEVPALPNWNALREIFLEICFVYFINNEVYCSARHAAYSRFFSPIKCRLCRNFIFFYSNDRPTFVVNCALKFKYVHILVG